MARLSPCQIQGFIGISLQFLLSFVLAGLVVTPLTFKQFGGNNQPLSLQCLATTNTGTQKFRDHKLMVVWGLRTEGETAGKTGC